METLTLDYLAYGTGGYLEEDIVDPCCDAALVLAMHCPRLTSLEYCLSRRRCLFWFFRDDQGKFIDHEVEIM